MIPNQDPASILAWEELVAKVLEKRAVPKKPWWESVGLVAALTAIATVALTSVGSYLTQSALRKAELQAQQRSGSLQAAVFEVEKAHHLATETLHYSDERARYQRGQYRALHRDQLRNIVDSVNASDAKWRQGRYGEQLGFMVRFTGSNAILAAWDTVVSTLNRYSACSVEAKNKDCMALRPPVDSTLGRLRSAAVDYLSKQRDSTP